MAHSNTDRELWRDADSGDSVHVTDRGGIGMNVGGHVIVKPLQEWHSLASNCWEAARRSLLEELAHKAEEGDYFDMGFRIAKWLRDEAHGLLMARACAHPGCIALADSAHVPYFCRFHDAPVLAVAKGIARAQSEDRCEYCYGQGQRMHVRVSLDDRDDGLEAGDCEFCNGTGIVRSPRE